jgi:hypothetical protein
VSAVEVASNDGAVDIVGFFSDRDTDGTSVGISDPSSKEKMCEAKEPLLPPPNLSPKEVALYIVSTD